MKELLSVKNRKKPLANIIKATQMLEDRLQRWWENLPTYLSIESPSNVSTLPPGILAHHKMWIYFSYYGTLSAIHSVFACPWNMADISLEQDHAVRQQINRSVIVTADIARKIILATRCISIDAEAPTW